MKALIISADHFEDSELLVPYYRLLEAGIEVDIASISRGKISGKHGYQVEAGKALKDVNPDDYALFASSPQPCALRRRFLQATSLWRPSAMGRKRSSPPACWAGGAPPATTL
jgi:hypothetical protein